jgi:hypothetical protein
MVKRTIHRTWNIKLTLMRGNDDNSAERLYGNIKFYGEESSSLRPHLVATVVGAYENFRKTDALDNCS